jgi:hypothetical protein
VASAVEPSVALGPPGPAAPARPLTQKVADGRFTVTFSVAALQAARGAGLNLPAVVSRALERINALLPGPATTIAVGLGPPGTVIPQTGAGTGLSSTSGTRACTTCGCSAAPG